MSSVNAIKQSDEKHGDDDNDVPNDESSVRDITANLERIQIGRDDKVDDIETKGIMPITMIPMITVEAEALYQQHI
jgi:hypothetical protein